MLIMTLYVHVVCNEHVNVLKTLAAGHLEANNEHEFIPLVLKDMFLSCGNS